MNTLYFPINIQVITEFVDNDITQIGLSDTFNVDESKVVDVVTDVRDNHCIMRTA